MFHTRYSCNMGVYATPVWILVQHDLPHSRLHDLFQALYGHPPPTLSRYIPGSSVLWLSTSICSIKMLFLSSLSITCWKPNTALRFKLINTVVTCNFRLVTRCVLSSNHSNLISFVFVATINLIVVSLVLSKSLVESVRLPTNWAYLTLLESILSFLSPFFINAPMFQTNKSLPYIWLI